MSVGKTPSSAIPSRNAKRGVAVCSLAIHFGGSLVSRVAYTRIASTTSRTSTIQSSVVFTPPELDDPAALFALFATKYATVTTAVTETRAPATYATEFLTQFSLVAKKNELMI